MVQSRGPSNSTPQQVEDEEDQKPVGRPGRAFRGQVVTHIESFVRTGEHLASLAALLGRNEETLRRWVREDATSSLVIPPASDDDMFGGLLMKPETLPGGVLGDILHKVLEQQSTVIVQTLREKSATMTLGELQAVLNSKLGRLVAGVRVKDIQFIPSDLISLSESIKEFQARKQQRRTAEAEAEKFREETPSSPPVLVFPGAFAPSMPTAAPSPAPESASDPVPESASEPVPASLAEAAPAPSAGLEARAEVILGFLREHPGWNRSGAVRKHVDCKDVEFRQAVNHLKEHSMVIRRGVGRATEYSLRVESAVVVHEAETTTAAAAHPTPATPASPSEFVIKEVLKVLYEKGRPLTPVEIRNAAHCTPTEFHKAIQFLKNSGEVTMVGKLPRPAYQVARVTPPRKSPQAIIPSEQVVQALRDTPGMGGTMTVAEIRGATKLSDEQVRRALHELLGAGRITREGKNANRRYGLTVVIG